MRGQGRLPTTLENQVKSEIYSETLFDNSISKDICFSETRLVCLKKPLKIEQSYQIITVFYVKFLKYYT